MKKKPENIELMKDDEVLREEGMTDGPRAVGSVTLRPITAASMSYMQRNHVFSEEGDVMQKTAAFVFIHSAPKDQLRAVVNERSAFWNAVDDWLEENINHHSELEVYSAAMTEAFDVYAASKSIARHSSPREPHDPKQ
jgi:hypothetical protein